MTDPTYTELRESISFLTESGIPEWEIAKLSGETALKELDRYEKENWPCPKIFIESEGVTFTWETDKFKIYQHFPCDSTQSEFYVFPVK